MMQSTSMGGQYSGVWDALTRLVCLLLCYVAVNVESYVINSQKYVILKNKDEFFQTIIVFSIFQTLSLHDLYYISIHHAR